MAERAAVEAGVRVLQIDVANDPQELAKIREALFEY